MTETRICKTCRIDFVTYGALEGHQKAEGHKGEIDIQTSHGAEAFIAGGLLGYGIYKGYKHFKNKKDKKLLGL